MKNERNIPDPELWEEITMISVPQYGKGDQYLKVDPQGNYHVIESVTLLDGKRVQVPDDCSCIEDAIESKGIPLDSPRLSMMTVVSDLSFAETAKWCARNLVPAPFDDYLLARV